MALLGRFPRGADIAPRLVPPGWGETVARAARRRVGIEGPDAVRAIARWDTLRAGWEPLDVGEPWGQAPR